MTTRKKKGPAKPGVLRQKIIPRPNCCLEPVKMGVMVARGRAMVGAALRVIHVGGGVVA